MATRKELANLTPGGIQIWAKGDGAFQKETLAQMEFKEIIFKGKIVLTLYIYEVEHKSVDCCWLALGIGYWGSGSMGGYVYNIQRMYIVNI